MKQDLQNRSDIEVVLEEFYRRAFADELIGIYFTEVVPLNLETHIPVIADFWDSVIFQQQSYKKNVMAVHAQIHQLKRIEKKHLDRWVQLFTGTIDQLYSGDHATLMKQRAASIATLMDIKLNHDQIKKL